MKGIKPEYDQEQISCANGISRQSQCDNSPHKRWAPVSIGSRDEMGTPSGTDRCFVCCPPSEFSRVK
jgi:hypothetical protein